MGTRNVVHAGIELIQQGWIQGSLLHNASAPKVYAVHTLVKQEDMKDIEATTPLFSNQWEMQEVALDENDLLVIVSQACDIQKAPDKEPYVEAVRAYWTSDRNIIHQAKRNSVYYFPLKERTISNGKEALIVDLRPRLLIKKEALRNCQPLSYFDSENTVTSRRFRQWLGRRYLRQALANELVTAIQQPVINAIRGLPPKDLLHDTLDSLREIRFFLLNETAPFQIEMLFLCDEYSENPSITDEDAARLANWVDIVLREEGKAILHIWHRYSTQEISVHDYENAYELPLHEFSLP